MSGLCVMITAGMLGGCTFVSSDGPSRAIVGERAAVTLPATSAGVGFALVDLTSPAVTAANRQTRNIQPVFDSGFSRSSSRHGAIGVGDTVNITIFEAAAGGLFVPPEGGAGRTGNFVVIPPQQVETNGTILVPYAGSVPAAGRTPQQVSREITARLSQRAVEPQVVVSVAERRFGVVNVLGDVNAPARITIDPGGLRLLEAIARAGGPRSAPYETTVILKRGNRSSQALLSAVVQVPEQNPLLTPGDVVVLAKEPKFYVALGATPPPGSIGGSNNRRFSFENDDMSLTEAAAKAGGLDPGRADPRSLFLYRLEPRRVLDALGVDTSAHSGELIPTIYTCDFSKPDTLFLANSFAMRSRDIIFVAEAPAVGLQRFTSALSGLTGNANAAAAIRAY